MLSNYVELLINNLNLEQRRGTAKGYKSTLCSIISYFGRSTTLAQIYNKEQLINYQNKLRASNCCWNTISFYMRTLQRIYNLAVNEGTVTPVHNLFTGVFTGYDSTEKRALNPRVIILLEDADFAQNPKLQFSRDMFMLSYYLQGISYIDMAYLRKTDIKNGYVSYHRKKSGSRINTPVEKDAMEIIQRYQDLTLESPYLLPIICCGEKDEYTQYQSALRNHNRRLKHIAKELGIEERLTSYVARHSWATNAYHFGVSTSVISQALGHSTESITRIYLAELDLNSLNDANETIRQAFLDLKSKDRQTEKENVRLGVGDGQIILQT